MSAATVVLHASCPCSACLRAGVTMCGLPTRADRQRWTGAQAAWCPVCLPMLHTWRATDQCPREVSS